MTVYYHKIRGTEESLKLYKGTDRLRCWARKWGMRLQPFKCNIMQITRKRTNKIKATYTLEGTVLENVDSIKYLRATITHDLRWITYISNMCTRRKLCQYPQDVKQAAYKGFVCPGF